MTTQTVAASTRTDVNYANREQWLTAAATAIVPLIMARPEAPEAMPPFRVSVGWPGGRGRKNAIIGQAWAAKASEDSIAEVFISPSLSRSDTVKVLGVLAHELCHVADCNKSGHTGRFAKLAKGIGLQGKMTEATVGDGLTATLESLWDDLGVYPHGSLGQSTAKSSTPKQTTRMVKLQAADCGYIVRTTEKWLSEGMPSCPHGVKMMRG